VPIQFLKGPHLRLFLGAVLISLSPVWVKLVSISPTTSGFYRVAIGSVTVAILMVFARQKLRLSKRAWMLVGLAGAFFSLDLFFWHRSIIYVGPGLSTLLANFQVFIMMSAGVVLLRQKPSATQLLAVPLALLGLVMIVGLDWQSLPGDYRLGVIFGLLTAIMYAGYLLSLRAARVNSESRLPLSEVAVVSIVCTLLLVLIAQRDSVTQFWCAPSRKQFAARFHDRGGVGTAAAADAEFRVGRLVLRPANAARGNCGRCNCAYCNLPGLAARIRVTATPVTMPIVTPMRIPATTKVEIHTAIGADSGSSAGSRNVHGRPANHATTLANSQCCGFCRTTATVVIPEEPRSRTRTAAAAPHHRGGTARQRTRRL
jgi:EamA domain-containing membrane protein RarD